MIFLIISPIFLVSLLVSIYTTVRILRKKAPCKGGQKSRPYSKLFFISSWVTTVITLCILPLVLEFFHMPQPDMSHVLEIKSHSFTKADGITIMLHGSGDKADTFARKVVEPMFAKKVPNRIFIVPDAPYKFTNSKDSGRCWHLLEDVVLNLMFGYVSHRMKAVDKLLVDFIDQVKAKYGCDKVEIVGFSDGAIMAMRALCLVDYIKVAHISSGAFLVDRDRGEIMSRGCRILVTHGMVDPIVYPFVHWINKGRLARAGAQNVTYKTGFYPHTFTGLNRHGAEWLMGGDNKPPCK